MPQEFVAVHVTAVVPLLKVLPLAGEQTTAADGVPVDVGSVQVAMLLSHRTMSDGHDPITGVSLIVTLKEHDELPHEFVAVHVTAVVPLLNALPLAGEQTTVADGLPVDVGSVHVAMLLSH